jgi:hypothetical protein
MVVETATYLETLDSTRRALTLMGTSARLVTQASDRLQTAGDGHRTGHS